MQYSAHHPFCAKLGERVHHAVLRALEIEAPLTFGILKDGMTIRGDTPTNHPSILLRLAPQLHERGVILLRFATGVTYAELVELVDLLTLPVQSVFDRGGLVRLALERNITHIQIEEIAHDITADDRDAQKRRRELRAFFEEMLKNLLAQRALEGTIGRQLLDLLEHPDIAAALLEDDPLGIADAVAGLCVMVKQEEERTGTPLQEKLHTNILRLSPASHERLLLGFPPLVGELREALAWALGGMEADAIAKLALPAFRRRAGELDVVLYALGVAVAHDGKRLAALRRLALYLYDMPADDPVATELLTTAARTVDDYDSYRRERACLQPHAARALAMRTMFALATVTSAPAPGTIPPAPGDSMAPGAGTEPPPPPPEPPKLDSRRTMTELVRLSARTKRFDRLCARLPGAAHTLAQAGSTEAVIGIVLGLQAVQRPEWRDRALGTLKEVASPPLIARLITDIDAATSRIEGEELGEMADSIKLLVALEPVAVLERLETC